MAETDVVGLPSGTVTFLLTDVEGSTKLWQRYPTAMPAVIARHYEILDTIVSQHGGIRPQEQGEGDSIVAAFTRASDAIAAAIEIQRAILAEPWLEDVALRVRMALHTGEPVQRNDNNYLGMAIIRCARIRAAGHGGQILISDATASLVGRALPAGATLVELGQHRLKDLVAPETIHQLVAADLPSTFPRLHSLESFRQNLPLQLTSLIGRVEEIADVVELVTRERIVTLTGAGGVGKTRLSIHVAAELLDRFSGGVAWVELAALRDEVAVAPAVLAGIGGREEGQRSALDACAASIGDDSLLIVLDNCEHLLAACGRVVVGLLARCPNLSVLVSSREPLGLPGEAVWRVPSLSLPEIGQPSEGERPVGFHAEIARSSAVTLFLDRARLVRPHLTATPAILEAAAKICRRLDGIPLAIELAAARCRTIPPEKVAELLDERFRLLTGGSTTLLARQQTLLASVRWSFELLDDKEQRILRRLSVFAGAVDMEAIETVLSSFGDLDRWDVFDLVSRLVDKSLVATDETDPVNPRYRLLETIRQFAAEEATRDEEWGTLRDAHAEYWRSWLDARWGPFPADSTLFDLARWQDEFRAASSWVASNRPRALALQSLLSNLWYQIGRIEDFRTFVVPLVFEPDLGDPHWVRLFSVGSYALAFIGRFDAFAVLEHAKAAAEQFGDMYSVFALETAATWAHPDPFSHLAALAERAEAIGSIEWQANSWYMAAALGGFDHNAAAGAMATTNLIRLGVNEPTYFSTAPAQLKSLEAMAAGNVPAATAHLWRAYRDAGGYTGMEARVLAGAVVCALVGGDDDAIGIVIDVYRSSRARTWELETVHAFACEARSVLLGGTTTALVVAQIGSLLLPARGSSELFVRMSHDAEADPECAFVTMWPQNGFVRAGVRHAAMRAIKRGDHAEAEDRIHELLAKAVADGVVLTRIDCLEWLAVCAFRGGDSLEAARLLGAADAARDTAGYRLRFRFERASLDGIDTTLDAYAEGRTLDLAEAVAYAQRMRGTRKRPSFGWASLTPTEQRVSDLAAVGKTNQQIATALIMGPGTVKSHLEHIYRKLGVSNRTELAAAKAQASELQ